MAEPGGTAQGDVDTMLALAVVAKGADCDVWKPQFCSNPERMCERRHIGIDHPKRAHYQQAYSWLRWSEDALQAFREICDKLGMKLALSVYLPEDVPTVAKYADILKIASFENDDWELLRSVEATSLRRIVSAGQQCDDDDGTRTRGFYRWIMDRYMAGFETIQCTSEYPAKITDLATIRNYLLSGLSDHSRDLDMGMMAVCAGATIIETHYRLYDCNPENPDYSVAFDPGELAMYVGKIRKAERAMGDGVKRVTESEKAMLPYRVSA